MKRTKLMFIAFLILFGIGITVVKLSQDRSIVKFNKIVSNPQEYNGKEVCTEGVFVSNFEMTVIAESTYLVVINQHDFTRLKEPLINIKNKNSIEILEENDQLPPKVRICGIFEYGENYLVANNKTIKYQIK